MGDRPKEVEASAGLVAEDRNAARRRIAPKLKPGELMRSKTSDSERTESLQTGWQDICQSGKDRLPNSLACNLAVPLAENSSH